MNTAAVKPSPVVRYDVVCDDSAFYREVIVDNYILASDALWFADVEARRIARQSGCAAEIVRVRADGTRKSVRVVKP